MPPEDDGFAGVPEVFFPLNERTNGVSEVDQYDVMCNGKDNLIRNRVTVFLWHQVFKLSFGKRRILPCFG
ncbi:MAG: hypothetical protein D6714_20480 [Bacteroidetes bacterium]|nr:MAG: hypothetical protein D6714_20480 [Bacteroidota bacterium]